jgi:hypothetical protein
MVTTHPKGDKTQRPIKNAPKLERHLSGSKTPEGNRVSCIVSLIHTWAPPYREELIELRKTTTSIENRVSYPSYIHGPLHTGKNSKSYEGYHVYRIPCVHHWQEEHLKVKPVPSDYYKSLVLYRYRYGKNLNVKRHKDKCP